MVNPRTAMGSWSPRNSWTSSEALSGARARRARGPHSRFGCRLSQPGHKPHGNRPDTVGELKSAEICMSHMPSLKAKKLGKLSREKVLLELGRGFANSIRPLCREGEMWPITRPGAVQKPDAIA